MSEQPLTLSVEEAAQMIGVSRGVAYSDVKATGKIAGIPVIRCGRRILIPRPRLEQMLGLNGDDPVAAYRAVAASSQAAQADGDDT
jgi:hypothetical protein